MQVFKLCMKVYKKSLPVMMIYFVVFIALTAVMSSVQGDRPDQGFEQSKAEVAFFSEEDTPLVTGLKAEIGKVSNFVNVKNDESSIQDALYFRRVNYIIRIPAGFSDSVITGKPMTLEVTSLPQSTSSVYVDLRVNHYLNTVRLLVAGGGEKVGSGLETGGGNLSQEAIIAATAKALDRETTVSQLKGEKTKTKSQSMGFSFNYLAYTMMFVLIMGMSLVMLILKKTDIKRRNAVSPLTSGNINRQLLAANLLFAFISWMILVAVSLIFNFKEIGGPQTWYFILNSFIFTLGTASISFLIGSLVKSQEAISAAANVFTLGSSFLGGVFVPQFLMGDSVLRFSSFLPVYWYVKANNRITELGDFGFEQTREIFEYMGIEVGFAVAFLVLALVIGKRKQMALEEQ